MSKVLILLWVGLFFVCGSVTPRLGFSEMSSNAVVDMDAMINTKIDMMDQELKLSKEQKAKLRDIMKAKMNKKQKMMEDKRKKMDALHEDFKAQLKTVLNEKQLKQWEASRATKGDMKSGCPMCKDGKKCPMCQMKKDKAMKDGCPMCKDGKMCEKCKLKKSKKIKEHKDGDHKGHAHK